MTITFLGRLPSMNEFIAANRRAPVVGNAMKQKAQDACMAVIMHDAPGFRAEVPCVLRYRFYEANKRRDLDNVSGFAHKVIQDALVAVGVIDNDGWGYISGFTDEFYIDKDNPRIELDID